MKLTYFLLWLAGGGLIALEANVCLNFLRVCESKHEAEARELWEQLVLQEKP